MEEILILDRDRYEINELGTSVLHPLSRLLNVLRRQKYPAVIVSAVVNVRYQPRVIVKIENP